MQANHLARMATVILRCERMGIPYKVLANGAIRIHQQGKPEFTPNRMTTGLRCMTAHAKGRVCHNIRGSVKKK